MPFASLRGWFLSNHPTLSNLSAFGVNFDKDGEQFIMRRASTRIPLREKAFWVNPLINLCTFWVSESWVVRSHGTLEEGRIT